MSALSDSCLTFPGACSLNTRQEVDPACEIAFLEWAQEQSHLFKSPIIRTLNVDGKLVSRVTVESPTETGSGPIFGCGRDPNLTSALAKAFGESLERIIALDAMKDPSIFARSNIKISNDDFSIVDNNTNSKLPPIGLWTSNGWAVHFDLNSAVQNAAREALERHILLYSFIRNGWKSLYRERTSEILGVKTTHIACPTEVAGHRAGIVVAHSSKHPGVTMGFTCSKANDFNYNATWRHASFEAVEPALYFENCAEDDIKKLLVSRDPLEQTQAYYILKRLFLNELSDEPTPIERFSSIEGHLLVLDIQKAWNLPFPFFAAYVFGGDLIPLAFKEVLKVNKNAYGYFNTILKRYGQELELPDVHPFL